MAGSEAFADLPLWDARYDGIETLERYQELYPDREVVQCQIQSLALGGGGVHCVTQQQPVHE